MKFVPDDPSKPFWINYNKYFDVYTISNNKYLNVAIIMKLLIQSIRVSSNDNKYNLNIELHNNYIIILGPFESQEVVQKMFNDLTKKF